MGDRGVLALTLGLLGAVPPASLCETLARDGRNGQQGLTVAHLLRVVTCSITLPLDLDKCLTPTAQGRALAGRWLSAAG